MEKILKTKLEEPSETMRKCSQFDARRSALVSILTLSAAHANTATRESGPLIRNETRSTLALFAHFSSLFIAAIRARSRSFKPTLDTRAHRTPKRADTKRCEAADEPKSNSTALSAEVEIVAFCGNLVSQRIMY